MKITISGFFRNVGANLPDHMTSHYRRPSRGYAYNIAVIGTDSVPAQERNITVYPFNYIGLVRDAIENSFPFHTKSTGPLQTWTILRVLVPSISNLADWVTSRKHPPAHAGSSLVDFSTLKMEAIRSSETSVYTSSTRRYIPEDGILQQSFCTNIMFLDIIHRLVFI
jgi:hypothetical protein